MPTGSPSQLVLVTAGGIVGCVIVSMIFRGRMPLPDEIRPLILTRIPLASQMAAIRADVVQTPLFNILARVWFAVVGPSDLAAKSLVILINALALGLFVRLAWDATSHWKVAAAAATLMYMRVGSSLTLMRMYGLMLLLVILAVFAWDRWIRTGAVWGAILWPLSALAAVYTHASAGLLLPAFIAGTWRYPEKRRVAVYSAVIVALAFLPWIAYVLPVIESRGLEANISALPQTPLRSAARIPFDLLSGEAPGGLSPPLTIHLWANQLPLRWVALAVHILLTATLFLPGSRARWAQVEWHFRWFVPMALVAPPLVLLVLSVLAAPVLTTRYVLVSLPAYWLALAYASSIGNRLTRGLVGSMIVWMAVSAALTWPVQSRVPPIRQTIDYIARQWSDGDILVNADHYPFGYQTFWEWHWRLHHRGRLIALDPEPRIPPWLEDVLPHRPLDAGLFRDVRRAWVISLSEERAEIVTDSLRSYGLMPVASGVDWPSLLRFDRVH